MSSRRVLQVALLFWAGAGAALALGSFGDVNEDARALVGIASLVGPLAALAGAWLLGRHADRLAGALLLVSACTPTYFAYPLNVLALVVGLALLVVPHALLRDRRAFGSAHHPA